MDNPAIIHDGDSYADLGATITAPQVDLNLGIKTFLNGTLVSNIVIDTSQVVTDTIDYVATTAGNSEPSPRLCFCRFAHAGRITCHVLIGICGNTDGQKPSSKIGQSPNIESVNGKGLLEKSIGQEVVVFRVRKRPNVAGKIHWIWSRLLGETD